jgi:hypothetical protein
MAGPDNSEESIAKKKRIAGELLYSCGLEKVELTDGSTVLRSIDTKKAVIPSFRPSSITQPSAIPFVIPDRKGSISN